MNRTASNRLVSQNRRSKFRAAFVETLEPRKLLASAGPLEPPVTWIPSPNYNSRGSTKIDAIVIHTTEESYTDTVNEFLDASTQVSAHFVNNTDGTITQMVDTANRAWHATYYNSRSIGIENVGYAGQASTWNSKNIASLEHLVAYLAYKYKIPVVHPTDNAYDYPNDVLNEPGIVAHAQVQPWDRTDPGPYFPWTQFITDVQNIIKESTTPPPPTQSPFGGTPVTIGSSAATIQAENYDLGGEGIAYHDVDKANLGGSNYRKGDGVDIQSTTDAGGGYNIGYVKPGEWLEYTVNVTKSGTYDLGFRVAYGSGGGKFHADVDGANVTGTMVVPNTGGAQNWTTITKKGVALSAGTHVIRLAMDAGATGGGSVGNFNYFTVAPTSVTPPTASQTIQAEDFDTGNDGVTYHDVDKTNLGGAYRSTGVDIQATTDTGGGYNVGWTKAGEWLQYTFTVATAGVYTLDFRVASAGSNGQFSALIDGANVTGELAVPNTHGWQSWATVSKSGVHLAAGTHVLRINMDKAGSTGSVGNFNWWRWTLNG